MVTGVDARIHSRENLFVFADVQVENGDRVERIRVRNLSPAGMMGEGSVRVVRGSRITVKFSEIDPIVGHVAWIQDDRFGVAFDDELDGELARNLTDGMGEGQASEGPITRRPPPHIG
ncbi:PilZ domain-containing protein [Altererythrobacter sp.]|uniref:PilZ domain-containing protein n=1 Tax=Altererythrobacter sp. TaxID=1872480 RepID=UPI003D05E1B1